MEKILCAAIWYKDQLKPVHTVTNCETGVVLCGHRHAHIIHQHVSLLGKSAFEMGEYVQGFLTNRNRFVDRKEAYKIAFENNQIIGPNKGYSENAIGLTSEDLY